MDDEPTLPQASRVLSIGGRVGRLSESPARKRVRGSSPPVFSSDPALFSSDDDPSADNYTTKRQKKKYRGPWYSQQPASDPGSESQDNHSTKGKRKLERQFDSGVWMGSDGTEVDDVDEDPEFPPRVVDTSWRILASNIDSSVRSHQKAMCGVLGMRGKTPEELAADHIHACLEEGTEAIELSSRNLSTLSNETIAPLVTFTCSQRIGGGVRFDSLIPNLEIYLGSNSITRLPEALFNLDRLTVLSLRHNELQELSPCIGRLRNLKELNVSQNSLNFLPYEILELVSDTGSLQNLRIHPNPFFEPDDQSNQQSEQTSDEPSYGPIFGSRFASRSCSRNTVSGRSWSSKWHVSFKFRTQVRFREINGFQLVKGPVFPSDTSRETSLLPPSALRAASGNSIEIADAADVPIPPIPRGTHLSRAPSLLEVALSACSKTPQLPYLDEWLPEDKPDHLSELLAEATRSKETGGSRCTICGRSFIIPRTEWIEWWEIARAPENTGRTNVEGVSTSTSAASPLRQIENRRDIVESMVPLIRRGCSWLCVPGRNETGVYKGEGILGHGERRMDLD